MDNGLLEGPLTSIRSQTQFESIAKQIRELPIFQERNERGHHMYSSALLKYAEYLSEGFDSDIESESTRSFPTRTSLQLRRVASSKPGSVRARLGSA